MTSTNEIINMHHQKYIRYQRESCNSLSLAQVRTHNIPDLTFSIFPFGLQPTTQSSLIVYRPFLMKFIMNNIENADFMVYTFATRYCIMLFSKF